MDTIGYQLHKDICFDGSGGWPFGSMSNTAQAIEGLGHHRSSVFGEKAKGLLVAGGTVTKAKFVTASLEEIGLTLLICCNLHGIGGLEYLGVRGTKNDPSRWSPRSLG